MINARFYKINFNAEEYAQCAIWCNANNATIVDKGEYYECVEVTHSLEELKQVKIAELKNIRDSKEVQPIEYNGKLYDYDDKSRDRINAAIIALDVSDQSMGWTCADNTSVTVTANDLRGVIACVAVRSNNLHVKYRELKELVEACTAKKEVDYIRWE